MISAGTLYTVLITGQAGSLLFPVSPGDVQTAIIGELQAAGFNPLAVTVKSTSVLPGITSFNFQGSVSARTTFPYAQDEDVTYQIGQAIQTATNYPATVSNPAVGDPAPDTGAVVGPLDSFLGGLNTDVKWIAAALVGLVVLVVIVGGKDTLKAAVR